MNKKILSFYIKQLLKTDPKMFRFLTGQNLKNLLNKKTVMDLFQISMNV